MQLDKWSQESIEKKGVQVSSYTVTIIDRMIFTNQCDKRKIWKDDIMGVN